jgi:hypothetical protein
MPALRRVIQRSKFLILESNSVLQFLRPDLYLVVIDPSTTDFKQSTRLYLDRANAFLLPESVPMWNATSWETVAPRLFSGRPQFHLTAGFAPDTHLLDFIRLHSS